MRRVAASAAGGPPRTGQLLDRPVELRRADDQRRREADGRAVGVLGEHAAGHAAARQTSRPVPSAGSMSTPAHSPATAHGRRRRGRPARRASPSQALAERPRALAWNSPVCSISTTASPTAQASGLPPKVEPCSPGRSTPSTSRFADDRGDRDDAAAERLAEQVHVGHDALVVARERLAGAAEAGLDLVGDEQHVVRGADLADRRQVAGAAGRRRRPRPGSARAARPTVVSSIAASIASASPNGTDAEAGRERAEVVARVAGRRRS